MNKCIWLKSMALGPGESALCCVKCLRWPEFGTPAFPQSCFMSQWPQQWRQGTLWGSLASHPKENNGEWEWQRETTMCIHVSRNTHQDTHTHIQTTTLCKTVGFHSFTMSGWIWLWVGQSEAISWGNLKTLACPGPACSSATLSSNMVDDILPHWLNKQKWGPKII